MSRVRGGVAAHDLRRAQATEMASHFHLRLTVTKIQTCGTQSTRLTLLWAPPAKTYTSLCPSNEIERPSNNSAGRGCAGRPSEVTGGVSAALAQEAAQPAKPEY
jgi:hypothetical protein